MNDDTDNVSSFAAARFNRIADPAAHPASAALDAAQEWVKSRDEAPDHIIIMIGRNLPDGSSGTKFFQAGNYHHHAQIGLCLEGMHMLRDSG